ncbi:peptidylprolyl isomerase [Aetokthonos hydrillicola Thurmond2011]|uniref:peptidylprolyl isomerase n=1 Tax=Aetokthonos hydrillicola Thurmond2011 TaxID=2712845 RepID=A0AAP5M8J7_9CYAN|nr:peptidylprolyl isomerase [Aetokthonos hydrillicola]MBO3462274.1 peptidylprolyl isomerase [Aetokthonos hydrillicola CCALA 1050]MBW4589483.1 peptidylprolyl isomerase [Aetokthonos hydrillicola CCALA 1050]MDR9893673.1 peptidylprolyl isomerase [Aetokthonos hydrillicola Thurmond2011]
MSKILKVGDRTITCDEMVPLLKQYGLLPQLVREVIIDNALANFQLTQEETMQAYKQFYQEHKLNAEVDLQAWLESRGLERQHLNHLATRNIKLERFKKSTWGENLDSYFIQRKAKLDRVIYSLIRVNDMGLAQELYFRIQEGEQSFSELAREFSEGPEAQTGGTLGPVELGTPHPMLANLLASSQPGQLLPPTRLAEWIVIVRLEKFFPAMLDESIQQRLINELFENWLQNQVKEYLQKNILVSR